MADDSELLRRYSQAQSEQAFSEFVRRHLRLVYCTALRRTAGRSDLAQDAAQAVFIKVARNASRFSRRASMAGWLYMAARFAAGDLMRSEDRRVKREQASELVPSGSAANGDENETLRSLIDELLGSLSQADREIVLLRYFEEQSFEEIGFRLRVSEDAARKRAERAIEKLRSALARHGITSSSATLAAVFSEQAAFRLPPELLPIAFKAALAGARGGAPNSGLDRVLDAWQSLGGVAGIVALLSIGAAVYEVHTERLAQAGQYTAQIARENAAGRLREHEKLLRASEARAAASDLAPLNPNVPKPVSAQNEDLAGRQRGLQFLAAHPEVQRLIESETRDHVAWWNEPVGRKIGLTPAQIEGLITLATEKSNQAITFGSDDGPVTLSQSLGNLSQEEVLQQTRALLGDVAYQRLTEEKRRGEAVRISTDAAVALNSLAMPLTPGQTQALEQIITGASPSYRSGGSINSAELDWDTIIQQANSLLSPEQMRAIEALRVRATADQEEEAYAKVLLAQVKGKP